MALRINLNYTITSMWDSDKQIYSRIILLSQPSSSYGVNINDPLIKRQDDQFKIVNSLNGLRLRTVTFFERPNLISEYNENLYD